MEIKRKKYLDKIEKSINSWKITLLIWPRRVWKTFFMKKFFKKYKNESVWYSFEDDVWHKFQSSEDFLNFLKIKTWKKTFKYIFLDEIQFVPGISLILKKIYDTNSWFKIICSWSWSFKIFSSLEDSLIWRVNLINVYPLTFQEFFGFKTGKKLSDLFENFYQWVVEDNWFLLEEFLKFWWYPEVVLADSIEEKIEFLRKIYDLWLNKDIKFILSWEDFLNFERLFKAIAFRSTSIIKPAIIANDSWVSVYKVKKFLHILEQSFVIFSLKPLVEKYSLEIKSWEKIYFIDIWLLNYIKWNFTTEERWELIENFVVSEIKKVLSSIFRLYFWKKLNQSEIDVVLKNIVKNEYIPIEVKTKSKDVLPKIFITFQKVYKSKRWILFNKSLFRSRKVDNFDLEVVPYLFVDLIERVVGE